MVNDFLQNRGPDIFLRNTRYRFDVLTHVSHLCSYQFDNPCENLYQLSNLDDSFGTVVCYLFSCNEL